MTLEARTDHMAKQFTVSGYVLDEARERLLLIHHIKLRKWLPPGGHVDEDETPQSAVVREVAEETGVAARLAIGEGFDLGLDGTIDKQLTTPLSMSYQLIPARAHEPAHIHIDMGFLLVEDATVATRVKADIREVSDAGWFSLAEIEQLDSFPAVRAHARLLLGPTP